VTESDLRDLLRDPACPYAHYPGSGGNRAILVDDLIRFARRRFGVYEIPARFFETQTPAPPSPPPGPPDEV
jgi:hypothetical protein